MAGGAYCPPVLFDERPKTMAKASIIPIFIPHAGCPHDCVFCNQRSISGTVKAPSSDEIDSLIKNALSCAKEAPEVAFYGGSFTSLPESQQEAYLSVAHSYIKAGSVEKIRVSTRPDSVTTAALERLAAYGVKTVELGAQSFDDAVLKKAGRGHDVNAIVKASTLVSRSGLDLVLQLMAGLPGDSDDGFIKSCKCAVRLKPNAVRIYPVVVLKETPLFKLWEAHLYSPPDVQSAVSICARALSIFLEAGITVIRLGLNPSEELSGGEAVAGAYHPAFGELVWSKLYQDKILARLDGNASGKDIKIYVHPKRASIAVGHKKSNIKKITERFQPSSIKIIPTAQSLDDICISVESKPDT